MTLKEAENKYPQLLTINFLQLISMWSENFAYNAENPEDEDIAEQLEALTLIKDSRAGS